LISIIKKSRGEKERKKQVLPKFLGKDELKAFLQVARFRLTANMWAMFVIWAYTGLRINEAGGLQWEVCG